MDAAALHALFQGTENLSQAERTTITKNFEAFISSTRASTLAAANMVMDADVVLVAAATDGGEVRVRASSAVLIQASSGFRGLLEESPGEIKLWRPGTARLLHPIAAVRFVISIVHADAAHDGVAHAAAGHDDAGTLSLDILLSACQIADCWDCPPVYAAAARCVQAAAAAESEPARVASTLAKMLRLVLDRTDAWLPLREAVEKAIASCVPFGWIPMWKTAARRLRPLRPPAHQPSPGQAQGGLRPRPASSGLVQPRAASFSLGQPRPVGRHFLAGRPHPPCLST